MKNFIIIFGVFVAVEIFMAGLMALSSNNQKQIYNNLYPNTAYESIDPTVLPNVIKEVEIIHEQSFFRKVDLLVISYHIPILAIIGIIGGNDLFSPYVFMPVNAILYFMLFFVVFKFRNRKETGIKE